MKKSLLSGFVSVYVCFSFLVFGQTQFSSADLKGRVTDVTDSVIVGASVSAKNLRTNATRAAVTDDSGEFGIYLLPPGEYEVKVESQGFESQVHHATFTVGQIATLNFQIRPGTVTVEVNVSDEDLPLLEPRRTHPASTLTQRVIESLPINGRNFLSFTLLSSGVVEESATVTNSLLQQLPTSRLIFAGQNGRSNSVTIDGVDNNDIAGNGVRPTISQEAVQEFQINHHSYNAELGRSSGGAINIVSKSGTNQLHGNFYDYFRHEKLDARNAFATGLTTKPPFKRNQPGFTLGGPLRKDRTFFFSAYEGLFRRESTYTSILSDPSILQPTPGQRDLIGVLNESSSADFRTLGQTLDALLTTSAGSPFPATGATFPMNRVTYKMLTDASGSFPSPQTTSNGSFRLDHMLRSKDQMLFRYNMANDSQHGIGVGG